MMECKVRGFRTSMYKQQGTQENFQDGGFSRPQHSRQEIAGVREGLQRTATKLLKFSLKRVKKLIILVIFEYYFTLYVSFSQGISFFNGIPHQGITEISLIPHILQVLIFVCFYSCSWISVHISIVFVNKLSSFSFCYGILEEAAIFAHTDLIKLSLIKNFCYCYRDVIDYKLRKLHLFKSRQFHLILKSA